MYDVTIREQIIAEFKANRVERDIWVFGCDECSCTATCAYAYDLYNLDGDCLAEK